MRYTSKEYQALRVLREYHRRRSHDVEANFISHHSAWYHRKKKHRFQQWGNATVQWIQGKKGL